MDDASKALAEAVLTPGLPELRGGDDDVGP
jgi:hypothetical protein